MSEPALVSACAGKIARAFGRVALKQKIRPPDEAEIGAQFNMVAFLHSTGRTPERNNKSAAAPRYPTYPTLAAQCGLSIPKLASRVGWVERSETHRFAGARPDGFR
jgi:hypothetical protein